MTAPVSAARRALCPQCARPLGACICRWIAPVRSLAHVLILQHPMEVANAKGSARLLQLSIASCVTAVGERFDPGALKGLLHAGGLTPVLLYPDLPAERALGVAVPPALDRARLRDPASVRLVVLDGTWRKSRKMLYQNAALQALPRLGLDDAPPSLYRIRKAHAAHQLSTLEATCYALAKLHEDQHAFYSLLNSFDEFVSHFQTTSGKLAGTSS